MANDERSVVIDVRAESEHLQSDLNAAAKKVKRTSDEIAQSQAKAGDEIVRKHKRDSEEKQKHAEDVRKKEKETNQSIKDDSAKTGDEVVKKHGEDSEKLKNQTEAVERHSKQSNDSVEKNAKKTGDETVKKHGEDTEKLKKQTDGYKEKAVSAAKDIGKAVAGIGAAMTAASAAAITSAAKDQTAFAKVKTLLSAEMNPETYADTIKAAVNETGVSFGALSESVYSAISASVDEKSAVAFTANAVKLAKGGFTDAATSVDVLTTAINAYSLSAEDASHISDVLITAQNEGKTTVNELASSMGQTIPIANGAGAAIEDLAAQYAVLTKNGVATAEAGTGIKAMLSELSSAKSTISKTLKEISGKSFSELQADGKSTADILNLLSQHAASSGKKLSDLFGSVEAGSAALTLVKDGGEDFNRILSKMENSAGATEKAYEIMSNTVEERFEKLKNRFLLGVSEIGEKILPYVEDFFDYVEEHSDEFESALEDAGKFLLEFSKTLGEVVKIGWEQKEVILSAVSAFAAYKTAVSISSIINGATKAIQGLNLAMAANPAGLIAAGIGLLLPMISDMAQSMNAAKAAADEYSDSLLKVNQNANEIVEKNDRETEALNRKIERYDELRRTAERTAAEEAELQDISDELQSVFGENVTVVNGLTGEYNDLTEAVQNYVRARQAQAAVEAETKRLEELYSLKSEIEKKKASSENDFSKEAPFQTGFAGIDALIWSEHSKNHNAEIDEFNRQIESVEKQIEETSLRIGEYTRNYYETAAESTDGLADSVQRNSAASVKSLEKITQAAEDCRKATGELSKEMKTLSEAFAEQNEDGSLSVETILSLVDAGYEAALSVDAETNAVRLDAEAYRELAQAKLDAQKADLQAAKAEEQRENIEKMKLAAGSGDYRRIAELTEENREIEAKYDVQMAALDQINLGKVTSGTYGNQTRNSSGTSGSTTKKSDTEKTEAEKNAEKYAKKKKDLDYQRSMDEISDDNYYKKLGEYRDTYLEKDSDAWRSANVDIHNHEKTKKEAAEKEKNKKNTKKSSGAAKGTVINIDSYIPTLWDDEEESNRKLQEALGIELAGNSQTGKKLSVELSDSFTEATSSSPSSSAVSLAETTAETTLSDVIKELRELKEMDTKRKISLDVDLYARDLMVGRIAIPDINEIAKQTGRSPFEFN